MDSDERCQAGVVSKEVVPAPDQKYILFECSDGNAFSIGPLPHALYSATRRKNPSNDTVDSSGNDKVYRMTQGKLMDRKSSGTSVVPTWFLTIVSLPVLIGLLWFGRDFLIPLALATLLFILNIALIDRLNSVTIAGRAVPRWMAYIGATALLFVLLAAFGSSLTNQAAAIEEAGPRYAKRLASLETQFAAFIGADRAAAIENAIQSLDIKSWLTGFAASTAGVIVNIGLILLYLAFMLGERGAFVERLPRLCATPDSAHQVAGRPARHLSRPDATGSSRPPRAARSRPRTPSPGTSSGSHAQ